MKGCNGTFDVNYTPYFKMCCIFIIAFLLQETSNTSQVAQHLKAQKFKNMLDIIVLALGILLGVLALCVLMGIFAICIVQRCYTAHHATANPLYKLHVMCTLLLQSLI